MLTSTRPQVAGVPVICVGNFTVRRRRQDADRASPSPRMLAEAGRSPPHPDPRATAAAKSGPLRVDPVRHDAHAQSATKHCCLRARHLPGFPATGRRARQRQRLPARPFCSWTMACRRRAWRRTSASRSSDGGAGFGNGYACCRPGRCANRWPAACGRAHALVLVGDDRRGARAALGQHDLPVIETRPGARR